MNVNSVNKVNNYHQYRKEYIRLSTAINRGKQNGLDMSELLKQREQLKNVYSIQPNPVYNNERIQSPVNKVYKPQTVYRVNKINSKDFSQLQTEIQEIKSELTELKTQLINITTSLTEQKEQLTAILTQLLIINQPTSPRKTTSSPAKKLTWTKLTPEEWLEKRRAYDRVRNKSPHRRAQLAQYKKNARLRKKLEREVKNK